MNNLTVNDYLDNLELDRQDIINSLKSKGVELSDSATFTEIVPKIDGLVGINEYMSDTIPNEQRYDSVILKFRTPLKMEGPNASGAFSGFKGTEIPEIDTSNVNQMNDCFSSCKNILTIPQIDTSNVTNMNSTFYDCTNLISIPYLNTSNVNQMNSIFRSCKNILTIPQIDTSNVTNMGYAFDNCYKLSTIPQIDTSNVTNMDHLFYYNSSLESVPILDTSKVNNINYLFDGCSSLTTLGGFKNLGQAYSTTASANYQNYTLRLSYSDNLTHESLMNVINNLYDIASKGCKPQKLQLGSTNLAKLTEEEIAIATNKGWTVS